MTDEEKIVKYDLLLQKYIDNKSFIKILRTIFDEEENMSGFLIGMSKDFILVQLDSSFKFDGYAIFRKDDFDSIRHSSFERTQRKIFKAEGLLEKEYGFDKHLPLTSWKAIFHALKGYDYHVSIKNRAKDYLDFWIGPILKVTNKSVSIRNYDPNGVLYEKPTVIKYDSISVVEFGDNYSTVFRKYLREKRRT